MYMNDAFHATNQIPQRAVPTGRSVSTARSTRPTAAARSATASPPNTPRLPTPGSNANAYFIGYQLQLFNNFDGFVTFPPPIGDQFVQQDRRKIYGGNVSYMTPGNISGYDAQNTLGFQTRTDDIHIDLAETTGRVVRFTVRYDHVIEDDRRPLYRKSGPMGWTSSARSRVARGSLSRSDESTRKPIPATIY